MQKLIFHKGEIELQETISKDNIKISYEMGNFNHLI
jgi:hypothetical protein